MDKYREKVYAGILGKITGVFYGRPVEGWPYSKIRTRFGMIDRYIAEDVGIPLHVADDDLSGTFTFMNTLEDLADICKRERLSPEETAERLRNITSEEFGEAWLDYIIEDKTIFWWGGIGRSTEHTAFHRLKNGIKAPESGAVETNGQAMAEQIGAQIFMDALPLMCPDDPGLARRLVKACASVSHDGLAVESACFLASLTALAFSERDLDALIQKGLELSESQRFRHIVTDVVKYTKEQMNLGGKKGLGEEEVFREVRDWLDEHYGYTLYPGNCHVVPNLTLIVASLLLGGNSYTKAMQFCVSGGWDTDCNGANLGVINAVRLGLDSLNSEFDFRTQVADRFYNISSDAGACVTDAVRQMNRIIGMHNLLYADRCPMENARFSFSMPGAVQGFIPCPYFRQDTMGQIVHMNQRGLRIRIAASTGKAYVSALTMWDPEDAHGNYKLMGTPILYEGQTVKMEVCLVNKEVAVTPYIVYYDFNDAKRHIMGRQYRLQNEQMQTIYWKIPENHGYTIGRLGVEIAGDAGTEVVIREIDWQDAPERFKLSGSLRNYDMEGFHMQMNSFIASARQFSFDATRTFAISHTEKNGVAVTGTKDWKDYSVSSRINLSIHERAGIIGRVRGCRRYYGLVMWDGNQAGIILRIGKEEMLLSAMEFPYELNKDYDVTLTMKGNEIIGEIDGNRIAATDDRLGCGGAGFLIDTGTFLADGFEIRKI